MAPRSLGIKSVLDMDVEAMSSCGGIEDGTDRWPLAESYRSHVDSHAKPQRSFPGVLMMKIGGL